MKIGGFQKVSTIDYPGEIACVVFLYGCNFKCGFCYNSDLVIGKNKGGFSEEYVLDFLDKRIGKLDGVTITGGEPLMSLDFDFVRRIKAMGFKVKIDTNGSCPERLRGLIDDELVDYVAMDVKGAREDYSRIVGLAPKDAPRAQIASDKSDRLGNVDLAKIEESMRIVDNFGGEFRTTVVGRFHNVGSLRKMGEWMGSVLSRKPKRIFLQGFKPEGSLIDSSFLKESEISERELIRLKSKVEDLFEEVGVRC